MEKEKSEREGRQEINRLSQIILINLIIIYMEIIKINGNNLIEINL